MKIKFVPQNIEVDVNPNKSVMNLALENGIQIHSVCKGVPSCAECRVRVVEGDSNVSKPTKAELSLIGTSYYIDGRRLSCQVKCFGPVTIDTTEQVERQDNPAKKLRGFKSQKQYESKAVLDTMLLTETPAPGDLAQVSDSSDTDTLDNRENRPARNDRKQESRSDRQSQQGRDNRQNQNQNRGQQNQPRKGQDQQRQGKGPQNNQSRNPQQGKGPGSGSQGQNQNRGPQNQNRSQSGRNDQRRQNNPQNRNQNPGQNQGTSQNQGPSSGSQQNQGPHSSQGSKKTDSGDPA